MGAARVSTEEVSLSDLALSGSQTCEAHLANLSSSLPCYKLPVPPFSGLDCADAAAGYKTQEKPGGCSPSAPTLKPPPLPLLKPPAACFASSQRRTSYC